MTDYAAEVDPAESPARTVSAGRLITPIRAWYVVGLLTAAHVVSFMDRMIMSLMVDPIRTTFNISDTQFSLLAGLAFAVFYALMGLPMGWLADRLNRRNLIAGAMAVWSSMTALCGAASGFWTLFVARMGVGVGEAGLVPASLSLISDYFPKHLLGRAVSVFYIGATLGSALAYTIGGTIITLTENLGRISVPIMGEVHGWQLVFFVAGVPGLLIAAIMLFTIREPARRGSWVRATPGSGSDKVSLREAVAFLSSRKKAFGAHILGIALWVMAGHALLIWSPTYLIRVFGFSHAEAGWTFGIIMLVAGTSGLMVGGYLADWLRRRGHVDSFIRVLLLAMLAMIPCYILLGVVTEPMWAVIALTLTIFCFTLQGGLPAGALQLMAPNQMRGQLVALYILTVNLLGSGLGPTMTAMLTDYVFDSDLAVGKSLAVTGVVICPLAALILWSGLKHIRAVMQETAD